MAVSTAAPRALTPPGALRDGVLWGAVTAYAALYFALGYFKYAAHRNFVDLGIFAQTAASAFGCFCNTIEGSHWAFHFSPILYAVGAVVYVWHSALALVAVQAIAGALTAPPVYGIVRRYADRKTALLTALVVLLYPPLAGVVFNDFHENGLAPAAVAWLLWAFDGGYAAATLIFAAVVLSIKEDQAIFLTVAGAIGAFAYRRDSARLRLAVGIAITAALVFVVYFALIQPHEAANPQWNPARFYTWTPWDWQRLPFELLPRLGYLVLAFLPLLFVPFRSGAIALAILPLGELLASRMSTTYTMGSHYAGAWIGYVFFAFALGIAAIAHSNKRLAYRILYVCLGLCVLEFAVADPLHPKYFLRAPAARDARLNRFLRALPLDADVATQEEAYTHLAATDPNATLLPELFERPLRSCYLLLDQEFPDSVRLTEFHGYAIQVLPRYGAHPQGYEIVRHDGGIMLYESRQCRAAPSAR